MNRDDIIRMAREAGMIGTGKAGNELERLYREAILDALPCFAALVAAAERKRLEETAWGPSQKWIYKAVEAEREACAKVCDEKVDAEYATGKVDHNEMGWTQACAIAIRARGQA